MAGSHERIIDVIAGRLKHQNCVFLLGAGASIASSPPLPSGDQLQRDVIVSCLDLPAGATNEQTFRAYKEFTQEYLTKINENPTSLSSLRFEVCVQSLIALCGIEPVIEVLEERLDSSPSRRRPPESYGVLAEFIELGLIKHILTVNFDELLENASKGIQIIYEKDDFISQYRKSLKPRIRDVFLWKLHGTLSHRKSIVMGIEDVQYLPINKRKVLQNIIENNQIVFVGYSAKDPDITEALHSSLETVANQYKWYWINPNPSPEVNEMENEIHGTDRPITTFVYRDTSDNFFKALKERLKSTVATKKLSDILVHDIDLPLLESCLIIACARSAGSLPECDLKREVSILPIPFDTSRISDSRLFESTLSRLVEEGILQKKDHHGIAKYSLALSPQTILSSLKQIIPMKNQQILNDHKIAEAIIQCLHDAKGSDKYYIPFSDITIEEIETITHAQLTIVTRSLRCITEYGSWLGKAKEKLISAGKRGVAMNIILREPTDLIGKLEFNRNLKDLKQILNPEKSALKIFNEEFLQKIGGITIFDEKFAILFARKNVSTRLDEFQIIEDQERIKSQICEFDRIWNSRWVETI